MAEGEPKADPVPRGPLVRRLPEDPAWSSAQVVAAQRAAEAVKAAIEAETAAHENRPDDD